jgi:hypothetical protein
MILETPENSSRKTARYCEAAELERPVHCYRCYREICRASYFAIRDAASFPSKYIGLG